MKALIFHSRSIAISEADLSTRPPGIIELSERADDLRLENVAAAFVCVEADDGARDLELIGDAIGEYSRNIGRQVLLVPFVHLSSAVAEPAAAKALLEGLRLLLQRRSILAATAGFGSHKVMEINGWVTRAHPGDVAFRDSRFDRASLTSPAN